MNALARINQFIRVFESRKMVAILLLGFASGLPFALTDDAFRAWLAKSQIDLRTIGLFSLVSLPYSLKFLWSPFLDRFVPPGLGRRRGWMFLAQIGVIVAITAIAFQMAIVPGLGGDARTSGLQLLAFTALCLAFLSATQDIAIDAYRTDVLEERETGAGASVTILGYRIALLATGWIAFSLADQLTWPVVYGLLAGLMAVGLFVSVWSPEPQRQVRPPETFAQAVVQPFQDFFQRLGWHHALFTIAFIILFRVGDAMVAKMAVPFLGAKGLCFSDGTIGAIRQGMGLIATIVGTLLGGAALSQLGVNKSLWVFGGLQAVSNLGYLGLALAGQNYPLLVLAINVENFCSGLGTAGFLGFLMSVCNARFSATQFALLSSLMAVGRDLLAGPLSGDLAQRWVPAMANCMVTPERQQGWASFFIATLIAALPGLLLLPFFAPWNGSRSPNTPS